jgi:hypothetical protein
LKQLWVVGEGVEGLVMVGVQLDDLEVEVKVVPFGKGKRAFAGTRQKMLAL